MKQTNRSNHKKRIYKENLHTEAKLVRYTGKYTHIHTHTPHTGKEILFSFLIIERCGRNVELQLRQLTTIIDSF